MTFYYHFKPKHENKKHAMFVCVCVCNQRNAKYIKVVAMGFFFNSVHTLFIDYVY